MKTKLHNLKRTLFAMIMLLGVGVTAWGATETPGNTGTSNTDIVGTSYTIPGSVVAGAGGVKIGTMPTKGIKFRLNTTVGGHSNSIAINVNSGYVITDVVLDGVTNDNTKTAVVGAAYVDGEEVSFTPVTLPTKNGTVSAQFGVSGVEATTSVIFSFSDVTASQAAIDVKVTYKAVSADPDPVVSDINYAELKGADNSANPTTYTEGTGVAEFEPLADVTGWHFTGWSPASISTTATGTQTITAQWEEVTPGPGPEPEPECPETGIIAKMVPLAACTCTIASKTEEPIAATYMTYTRCELAIYNANSSAKSPMLNASQSSTLQWKIDSGDYGLHVTTDCTIEAGDEIIFTGNNGSNEREIYLTTSSSKPSSSSLKTTSYKYVVTAEDGIAGTKTFYAWRVSNTTYIQSITVRRPAAKHDIHYAETRDADMSAYPTQYEEGVGVAEFAPLAGVTGWDFAGWSPASISAEATTDVTITATWTAATAYSVTYALGEDATGTLPTEGNHYQGDKFTLAAQGDIKKDGYDFAGWNDGTNTYAAGAEYTVGTANVVLTAQWTVKTVSDKKQLTRVKFSNGFDAFVKEGDYSVKAYYLGETESTVVADSWTVSEKATAAVGDGKIVVTAEDGTTQDYAITLTKVEPYATYDEVVTLDGTQAWVVGGGYNGTSGKEYYAANKSCDEATNMRIAEGKNRINLFVGACSAIDLKVAAQRNLAVYKNGVVVEGLTNSGAKDATFTIPVNEENPCYITIVNTTDCGAGDLAFYNLTLKAFVTPAATPTFTTDLNATASFEEGADVTLTVEATTTDAGVLSYQWYKNDAAIAEATAASLVVKTAGNYKVVVTNTLSETNKATATSTVCAVTMNEKAGCNYVGTPEDGETWYTSAGNWTLYSADSNGRKGGSKFGENKNFDGVNVPEIGDQRFLFVPAKDMEEVQVYATASAGRTLNNVKVTNEVVEASASKPTYVDGGIEVATANVEEVSTHYVFTATGNFEAGKCYWFAFSGTVYSFRICYTEAMPKADEPELNTLANETACGTFAELKATEGAVSGYSYQWYKDAEAIAEATAYNYQPTEAGVYYCAVTNSQADRRDNTKNTNEATLSLKAATTITAHSSLNARGAVDADVTLSVTATGEGTLAYAWYTCDDEAGANATIIPDAETDSYVATIAAGTQYYKVVVTGECGDAELTFAVSEKVNVELQPVTKTTTWDWANTTYQNEAKSVTDMVLANIDGVTNDENFESDKIMFTGNWGARNESGKRYMRATEVKMNFEVGGLLTIYFRGTAGDKSATVEIYGKEVGHTDGSPTYVASDKTPVLGETTISLSGSGGSVQIYKIEFQAADYTRNLNGKMGTHCYPFSIQPGNYYGASFYQIAYRKGDSHIYWDEVKEDETIEAGVPYLVVPNEDAAGLIAFTETSSAPAQTVNGFVGSYTQEVIAANAGNYIVYNNEFRLAGANVAVGANRAYIHLADVDDHESAPVPGRRRITMNNAEANTTTALENVSGNVNVNKVLINGQLYIVRDGKMYNVQGALKN